MQVVVDATAFDFLDVGWSTGEKCRHIMRILALVIFTGLSPDGGEAELFGQRDSLIPRPLLGRGFLPSLVFCGLYIVAGRKSW